MDRLDQPELEQRADISETVSAASAAAHEARAEREARAQLRKKRLRIYRIKAIWNGMTTVLVGMALILAILIWGLRLMGMDVFIVQSGSMEPDYKVGGVVYVSKEDPEKLRVGDVITFRLAEDTLGTHRIIEVLEENGAPAFRTKGDANDYEDTGLVTPDIIVGKVRFTIPQLGYFVAYIQEPPGSYIAFCVVAGLLVLTILPDILFDESGKADKSGGDKKKKSSGSRNKNSRKGRGRSGSKSSKKRTSSAAERGRDTRHSRPRGDRPMNTKGYGQEDTQ